MHTFLYFKKEKIYFISEANMLHTLAYSLRAEHTHTEHNHTIVQLYNVHNVQYTHQYQSQRVTGVLYVIYNAVHTHTLFYSVILLCSIYLKPAQTCYCKHSMCVYKSSIRPPRLRIKTWHNTQMLFISNVHNPYSFISIWHHHMITCIRNLDKKLANIKRVFYSLKSTTQYIKKHVHTHTISN